MIWRKIFSILNKEKAAFGNLEHLEKLAEELNKEYFRTLHLDYSGKDIKPRSTKPATVYNK